MIYNRTNIIVIICKYFYYFSIFLPFQKSDIYKIIELENYENFIFISLKEPLLTLDLLDYELNEVNTIIKLTNFI